MKKIAFLLCIFFLNSAILLPQVTRTYSSKEDSYASWITRSGITPEGWVEDHQVGAVSDRYIWETRTFNTWEWTYSEIPTEAVVTSVRIKFIASKSNNNNNFHMRFHNIGYKLSTQNINFFNECVSSNQIYDQTFVPDQYNTIYFDQEFTANTATGVGKEIWEAVTSAVQSGNYFFTLAIREIEPRLVPSWKLRSYDGSSNSTSPAIDLTVTYTVTDPTITIDQRLSGGTSVGTLRKWEGSAFGNPFNPGLPHTFVLGSTQTIQGTQTIYSNEKYNRWNNYTNVNNHKSFTIKSGTPPLVSNLAPTYSGIIIKNYIDEVASGGTIEFKDPWLIDYPDPSFANTLRNRDSLAVFYSRQSPFNPDYSTSYSGKTYKGVFLNENIVEKSMYSVRTLLNQDIYLSQTNKTHKCYFQNWGGTGVTFYQNETNPAGYDQKDVAFSNSSATASAVFKGTQLSNDATAFSRNSQRKLIQTSANGTRWLHQVYASMGHVWIEHSSNNGSTWVLGNNGRPLDVGNGKCPSITFIKNGNYNCIAVVWQQKYGERYTIEGKIFNQGNTIPVPLLPTSLFTEPADLYSVDANPNVVIEDGLGGWLPYCI